MKKQEVKIGGTYTVKVSGSLVPVKLVSESRCGGWDGVNITTGRHVRVKTAARLRREHPAFKSEPEAATSIDWSAIYDEGKCPDCGTTVPKRAVAGAACTNCGHVFCLPQPTDDAPVKKVREQ